MKTKSFQEYLKKRLSKDEIAEIKEQAHLEIQMLRSQQNMISDIINDYEN